MALGRGSDTSAPGSQRDYLKLVMALCCVAAVGIAGTTYDSTLESDPDEIIDVKHEWLPIGKDPIQDFKNPESSASAGGGGGGGSDEEPAPCTGGIIGVLANLFPSLIPPCGPFYLLGLLLPFLLFLAALALTVRYRRRLVAPVLAVTGWLRDRAPIGRTGDDSTGTWPREEPTNDIHRAWLAMVEQADIKQPWRRTPTECARAAVDAGLEFEAVDTLTQLFVEVKYGGAALTDERRQQAHHWRQRLTDGSSHAQPHADGSGDAQRLTDGGGESP